MNLTVFKNDLLPVYTTELGNKVVKAKELHEFLNIKEKFTDWVKRKVSDHQLHDNKDYCIVSEKSESLTKTGKRRVSLKNEYILRIEAAKKIAMGTNNAQGDKVKDYFLACERVALRVFTQTPKLEDHSKRSVQITNSKDVNAYKYVTGGIESVTEYNRLVCKSFTGKYPSELKKDAKEAGFPSKKRTSGKEVIRNTNPAVACAMSLTDDLVKMGMETNEALTLTTNHAIAIFAGMLKVGITPTHLGK